MKTFLAKSFWFMTTRVSFLVMSAISIGRGVVESGKPTLTHDIMHQ